MNFFKTKVLPIFITTLAVVAISGCGSSASTEGDDSIPPEISVLTSIDLTLASGEKEATSHIGVEGSLVATGTYSDGAIRNITDEVTYNVDDEQVMKINSDGSGKSLSAGVATTTATLDDIVSNDVTVTVVNGTLVSITIEPMNIELPIHLEHNYVATGTYSDGLTDDITHTVAWDSNDTNIASIDAKGLLTTNNVGQAKISATQDGIVEDTTIYTIHPALIKWYIEGADSVTKGSETHLLALGDFDNGKTYDVGAYVSWTSGKLENATVDNDGVVTGVKTGLATITATRKGQVPTETQTHNIAVVNETFESISIEYYNSSVTNPNPITTLTVPLGGDVRIAAWGIRSNGERVYATTDVLWRSDNSDIASINSIDSSQVYGINVGGTEVTATMQGIEASVVVEVEAGFIFEENVRFEKDVTVDTDGKTATGTANGKNVWYHLQKGQGYVKGQTVAETNFSFEIAFPVLAYVNVYLLDAAGNPEASSRVISDDADWTALQNDPATKGLIIRTDYREWSEGQLRQSNFIARFGDSTYGGIDTFNIKKYELYK